MPERDRRQTTVLFEAALQKNPDQRSEFLQQACGGDDALLAEVQSLVAEYEQSKSHIEDIRIQKPSTSGDVPQPNLVNHGRWQEGAPRNTIDLDDLLTAAGGDGATHRAEQLNPVRALKPVGRVGKYEILDEVGRGGFGTVYRARDPVMNRDVAIKVLTANADDSMMARFQKEAGMTGNLSHKNIVTVYDYGRHEDGRPYIVMEYLEGRGLDEIIADPKPLPILEKVEIIAGMAAPLAYAHTAGIIHRDIKPSNVMLLRTGEVKVLDFGIARIRDSNSTRQTSTGFVVGTLEYMSPDQIVDGRDADYATDIYAYGVTCYELLTGVQPFRAPLLGRIVHLITTLEPQPLTQLATACPERLAAVIHRAIAKNRAERYRDFGELIEELGPILAGLRRERAQRLAVEAEGLLAAGEFEMAQAALRRLLELDPANEKGQDLRRLLQRQRELRRARQLAQEALETAEEHLRWGRFDAAIQSLKSVLAKLPTEGGVGFRRDLELSLERAGTAKKEEARRREEEVRVRVIADFAERVRSRLSDHDLEAASTAVEAALERYPDDADLADLQTRVKEQLRQEAEQKAAAERARLSEEAEARREAECRGAAERAQLAEEARFAQQKHLAEAAKSQPPAEEVPAQRPAVPPALASILGNSRRRSLVAGGAMTALALGWLMIAVLPGPSTETKPANGSIVRGPAPDQNAPKKASAPSPDLGAPLARAPAQTGPLATARIHVEMLAQGAVSLLARSDGRFDFQGTVDMDQRRIFEGRKEVSLRVGDAGSVAISFNGKPIGPIGPKGRVRSVVFTPGGFRIETPVTSTPITSAPGPYSPIPEPERQKPSTIQVSKSPVAPPDPLARDREAVLVTLNAFSQAIERKDEVALRNLWPGISARNFESWRKDFENTVSISMTFRTKDLPEISGETARVECETTTSKAFYDSEAPYNYVGTSRITLGKRGDTWVIESIR